jgi:cytochrome c oxidase subunit II
MASRLRLAGGVAAVAVFAAAAIGSAAAGQPVPWQMGFQEAASPIQESVDAFHNMLLVIITLITLFVLALIATCIIRYNRRSNPTPSRTTHNTTLEVAWTVLPVIILVVIAIPSFRLLYDQLEVPEPELTIKTTGHQWYWSYEYPDHGVMFDQFMLRDDELEPGQPRLLATDSEVVVPVNTVVKVLVTASDVIHAWKIPALGSMVDAVPGRINETWFQATREGVFYGQCSELCGRDHAFMPITVRVVAQEEFDAWIEQQVAAAGGDDEDDTQLARLADEAREAAAR